MAQYGPERPIFGQKSQFLAKVGRCKPKILNFLGGDWRFLSAGNMTSPKMCTILPVGTITISLFVSQLEPFERRSQFFSENLYPPPRTVGLCLCTLVWFPNPLAAGIRMGTLFCARGLDRQQSASETYYKDERTKGKRRIGPGSESKTKATCANSRLSVNYENNIKRSLWLQI